MKELNQIQVLLNAPKNQKNTFGKYNYRSCEDILEGLKPLLKSLNCAVILTDTIELIGDRYYVKATAKLINSEGNIIESVGYARETEQKKGMDSAQLTGSTSSYARKYALNGLFAIDDNKDADSMDNRTPTKPTRTFSFDDIKPIILNQPAIKLALSKLKMRESSIISLWTEHDGKLNKIDIALKSMIEKAGK